MMGDFELLKEVPGYKAILKVVLKSQIQLLIDQLCKYTGEESFILTANASDGAQSVLGSGTGKGFLENRIEIKTEFLGYCLKSLHKAEETVSCLRNTWSKVRTHPYTKGNTSSPPGKSSAHFFERNGFSEFESLSDSDKTYLNDTRGRDSRLMTGHHAVVPDAGNNIDKMYNRKDTDSWKDTIVAQSQDMFYDIDYIQASSNVDLKKETSDGEKQASSDNDYNKDEEVMKSNVLTVKQEVDSDDVEVTGIELGPQCFRNESNEYRKSSQYNQNTNNDDLASLDSSDVGISDMSSSELNASSASGSKHYYPCRFCGRVFQHNSWLTRHLRSHTGEKPYECHVCGKRFTRAGTMKVHMLMHSLY